MSAAGELRALSAIALPDVAVITNVAPVHLEFFASVDAIAEAKAEILEGLRASGVAVLNGDDPRVRRIGERHAATRDLVRARPALRRLGREVARHHLRHALRSRSRRTRLSTWRCRWRARTSSATSSRPRPSRTTSAWTPEAIAEAATRLEAAPHRGRAAASRPGRSARGRLLQLEPAGRRRLRSPPSAWPAAGGVSRSSATCSSSGPRARNCIGRRASRSPSSVDVVAGVGALASELVAGARAANASLATHHFADSAAAPRGSFRAGARRVTPCS